MNRLAALQQAWGTLQPRERLLISAAAAALGMGLLWAYALGPALRTLHDAPAQRAVLQRQLDEMRRLADEADVLRRQAQQRPDDAKAVLARANQRIGIALNPVLGEDGSLSVALEGVSAAALYDWLVQARRDARMAVAQASLSASAPGVWSGTVRFEAQTAPILSTAVQFPRKAPPPLYPASHK